MAKRGTPPRHTPLFGAAIAVQGTSIVLQVTDGELALFAPDQEVTEAGWSSTDGDAAPVFEAAGDVYGSITFRAKHRGQPDKVLGLMQEGTTVPVSIRQGRWKTTGNLLIGSCRKRLAQLRREVAVSCNGHLSDVIEEVLV